MCNSCEKFAEYYVDYRFIAEFLEEQFDKEISDYLCSYRGRVDEDYLLDIRFLAESIEGRFLLRRYGLSPISFVFSAQHFLVFLKEHWQELVFNCSTDKTAPKTWIFAALQKWAGIYKCAVVNATEELAGEEVELLLDSLFCSQAAIAVMLTDEGFTDGLAENQEYFTKMHDVGICDEQIMPSQNGHSKPLSDTVYEASWHVISCALLAGLEAFFENGVGKQLSYEDLRQINIF